MYRLVVLGATEVLDPTGVPVRGLMRPRSLGLLAALAAEGARGAARDRLTMLLWGEMNEARASHNLAGALYLIRRVLTAGAVTPAGKVLFLNRGVVSSDVDDFQAALRAGDREAAVAVYGGPFLEGFHLDNAPEFEHWVDAERTRLMRQCGQAIEDLASTAENAADWAGAAKWWARATEHDPYDTRLVMRRIRMLATFGDRANALRLAEEHRRRLATELQLEPEAELLAEEERLRRGSWRTPVRPLRSAATLAQGRGPAPVSAQTGRDRETERRSAERRRTAADRRAASAHPEPRATVPPTGQLVWWRRRAPRRWAAVGVVALLACTVALWPRWRGRTHVRHPRTAIAVLPLENLSAEGPAAYFASGLHDELLTQLAKVGALTVIGRTSVLAYGATSKPLRQIGDELGAGCIVEGSVQVVGERIRVIARLVDAVTQAHLWADTYDRPLEDAFALESDIAQRIATGVGATLTSAEAEAMATAPTQSAEAYQLYLQGLQYYRRPDHLRQNLVSAQQLLERAVAYDSTFALAHAALSLVHGDLYRRMEDPSAARAALQLREAEAAGRLAPELPQSHVAMGVVHYNRWDYDAALSEFDVALQAAPGDAEVWAWSGFAHRGLGNWDSVEVAFRHASRLDPRNASLLYELRCLPLSHLRRYPEAIAACRQALALAPDFQAAHLEIGWTYVKWNGELDTLRAAIRALPPEAARGQALPLAFYERRPDSVLALLRAMPKPDPWFPNGNSTPRALMAAWAHLQRGDSAAARAAFASAAAWLDSVERARPGERSDGWVVHGGRGVALAALGRRTEALREARWLEHSAMYRRDEFSGEHAAGARQHILMLLGQTDSALAEIERLLASPSMLTVHVLRLDPQWDPIRNDPRFQALLMKYADAERP